MPRHRFITRDLATALLIAVTSDLPVYIRAQPAGAPDTLASLVFMNSGTSTPASTLGTSYLIDCSSFSECTNVWTCWNYRDYPYISNSSYVSNSVAPPAPPLGIRSAVPLGGLGTGSLELRGDGAMYEWMLEGQGTALAADATRNSKIFLKDEALFGLRAASASGATVTTSLRTVPPPGIPAAPTLEYAGAFPFSRLGVNLSSSAVPLTAALFSYSPFVLGDANASAVPAIIFSLLLNNTSPSESVDVSLMLSLPLASEKDTDRRVDVGDPRNQTLATLTTATDQACLAACNGMPNCTWWHYSGDAGVPPIPPVTMLNSDCPGNDLPDTTRVAVATLQECINHCGIVPTCQGVVFDQIPGEQQQQCNNNATDVYCCLPKTTCTSYDTKDNDTAWAAGSPGTPSHTCTLYGLSPAVASYMPRNVSDLYASGVRTGVKGAWMPAAVNGLTALTHVRDNGFDASLGAANQDPAVAQMDYTLLGADADALVTWGTGDTIQNVWAQFVKGAGALPSAGSSSVGHGAVSTTVSVPAATVRTLTIILAWHAPHRMYVGQDLGNAYAARFNNSIDVAARVASNLTAITAAAASLNHEIVQKSTLPEWYADFLQNSIAMQSRMTVWVANDVNGVPMPGGRFRTYEAFSNCDLEPVHVSDYHLIPYILFWPHALANVLLTGWGPRQLANGMVQEFLGDFSAPGGRLTGEMDLSAGGRVMGDTTTVFILSSLAVWQQTADVDFLRAVYPFVSAAATWQVDHASANNGFPGYLQTTYDYLGMGNYPYAVYNGFLHMAAMRAFRVLAAAIGDNSTLPAAANASEVTCGEVMQAQLWTGTYWRAYQTPTGNAPNVTMTGSLHGQTWAALLGLGALAPQEQLASHIAAEYAAGCAYASPASCALGLMAMPSAGGWGRSMSPSMNMDTTAVDVWLRGATALNASGAQAVVELYRTTLNDPWNVHDLHVGPDGLSNCNAGQGGINLAGAAVIGTPFVNSHYQRHVQGWAILQLMTGASWNAATRVLSLSPRGMQSHDAWPVFAGGIRATLTRSTLTVHAGTLHAALIRICDADVVIPVQLAPKLCVEVQDVKLTPGAVVTIA